MLLNLSKPTALAYFDSLVGSDDHFPLLEAAASIAQDEYPELDVQQVLCDVDRLMARLGRRLTTDGEPLPRLRALNQFFFRDLGFGANLNHFHDPDNSYLNVLLRTRRGIPISLGVLWMALAQGMDLNVQGIGFPGHFMLKVHLPRGTVVLDPLTGKSLTTEDLSERLAPHHAPGNLMDDFEAPIGLYLQAAEPRAIIARMLRNLKEIHRTQEDWPRMLAVQNRLVILLPEDWIEYRDRGLIHAELGNLTQAVQDLDTYLARAPEQLDHRAIELRLSSLRGNRRG
jgi:regulator of sirC expression with transglutaminase-like and TPR domain